MRYARTCPWIRMRRYRVPLRPSVTFSAVQSWAGSIISMSGFDLRQAQGALAAAAFALYPRDGIDTGTEGSVPTNAELAGMAWESRQCGHQTEIFMRPIRAKVSASVSMLVVTVRNCTGQMYWTINPI